MSSLFAPKTKAVSSNPAWVDRASENLFNAGTGIYFNPSADGEGVDYSSLKPLEQYGGERVAPLTSNQNLATKNANQLIGSFQPYFDKAVSYIGEGTQRYGQDYNPTSVNVGDTSTRQWGADYLNQYMNPYTQAALDPAAREVMRNADIMNITNNDKAAMRGSFGNSRTGLVESETNRNALQGISDLYTKGLSDAYDKATGMFTSDSDRMLRSDLENMSKNVELGKFNEDQILNAFNANRDQFNTEGNRFLQGAASLGNLATQKSNVSDQNISRLMKTGAQGQVADQANLDTAYQDFLANRDYPQTVMDRLMGLVKGSPASGSVSNVSQPSIMGQLAGMAAAVIGGASPGQSPVTQAPGSGSSYMPSASYDLSSAYSNPSRLYSTPSSSYQNF